MASPGQMAMAQVQNIKIKEKVRLLEAASALMGQEIEMANKYKIMDHDTGAEVFYAVEETSCLAMQCKQCADDCAPWKVSILYTGQGGADPAFEMNRDWTCTFCCFNRPQVTVTDVVTGEEFGTITDPCTMCNFKFDLRDEDGEMIGRADGGCCQWGMLFPCPCGPCARIDFDLQDAEGESVGHLTKKIPGCCKFVLAPDVDNYIVELGNIQDPKLKTMFMALSIFMDFRYFNDNSNDDDGGMFGEE